MFDNKLKSIKIGHLNARSLGTGFDFFTGVVLSSSFDIMCVSETWLNDNLPSDYFSIPNYRVFRHDRHTRGGGVCIYARDIFDCKIVMDDFATTIGAEYLWLQIKTFRQIFLLGVVYRVSTCPMNNFIQNLEDILSFVLPQYDIVALLGDVNVDHTYDNIVAQTMQNYNFSQLISEPTRITKTSSTIIDIIYINKSDFVGHAGTINTDLISDHRAVFCELNLSVPKAIPKIITYRNFKYFNRHLFIHDLQLINWDTIYYLNDINTKISFLYNNILNLFDKHAPYTSSRITKPYAPWITSTIKDLQKIRNRALSKYKKSKSMGDWSYYKFLRNYTLGAIRREKKAFLDKQMSDPNKKLLWNSLNNLHIKKRQDTNIPGNLCNPDDINKYFLSVFTPYNNCPASCDWYNSRKYNPDISFSLKMALVSEVHDLLFSLKSHAFGFDNVNAKMLQLCSPALDNHLTHILNCCLEMGYFPDIWKISVVKPLPKIKIPVSYSDLRPISLISTLSKILERIIYNQLMSYVNENNILSCQQSGFRKGYSTTSVLACITDNVMRSLDRGDAVALVLLDFSKAFDTLDQALLCSKLNYYGLDAISVDFFKSYFRQRSQIVSLDDRRSQVGLVTSGVPQGSILGPLLFLIYTSDIFSTAIYSNISAYADDTQIYLSFNGDIPAAANKLNSDLESISRYANENNLKLNPNKCSVIYFSPKNLKTKVQTQLALFVDGQSIEVVSVAKNLGLFIDSSLRFREHVATLVQKSYASLRLLYSNISIINFKLRKKLTEVLVLSILNYSSIVYFPCLDKFTQYRLQKIQNSCCRFIFGLRKYDRVSKRINQLGWLTVENTFKLNFSVFIENLMHTSSPFYLREKLVFRGEMHNTNIRYPNNLTIPRFRTVLFTRSFTYCSYSIYNKFNIKFKNLSLNEFRKKLKSLLLSAQTCF